MSWTDWEEPTWQEMVEEQRYWEDVEQTMYEDMEKAMVEDYYENMENMHHMSVLKEMNEM